MRLYVVGFFILFQSLACFSDQPAEAVAQDLKLKDDGNSIYNVHLITDSIIILAGATVALGANALQYSIIQKHCPCDPNGINFIDRGDVANENKAADVFGNYLVTAALLAPVAIDFFDVGLTKSFAEDMFVYTEVLAVNFGLVTTVKFATQRPYPYMYRKAPDYSDFDPTDYLSFYSGHTATTFSALTAASVTLNLRHKQMLWPWLMTGVMGTAVATSMVLAGEHFTTDVIVGAIVGLANGITITGLHARDPNWWNRIRLMANSDTAGLGYQYDL